MKEYLLGSSLGLLALYCRDRYEILKAAYSNLEGVGMVANDQLGIRLATNLCQPHKTFLDVGAHIGSVIAQVIRHDSAVRIIAVEAVPAKAEALRRRFPTVDIQACAVGDASGEVSFFINLKRSGYSSLIKSDSIANQDVIEIKVPLKRLDDIVLANDVDVIKLDVEGAELQALRGAHRILQSARPIVFFESGAIGGVNNSAQKSELYQFLTERQYRVLIPNRLAHNDDGLSLEGFLESHRYPRRTNNYFAVPQERRGEIQKRARQTLGLSE